MIVGVSTEKLREHYLVPDFFVPGESRSPSATTSAW